MPTFLVALLALSIAVGGRASVPVGAYLPGVAVGLAGWIAATRRGSGGGSLAFLALLTAVGGLAWGSARADQMRPVEVRGSQTIADARVIVDQPPSRDRHGRWRAIVVGGEGAGVPTGTRLLADLPAGRPPPEVGTLLRVSGMLRSPVDASSPDWWRGYLERRGIAGRLRIRVLTSDGRRGGIAGLRDGWRTWVGERAGQGPSGDTKALLRGMAIGSTETLSVEAADDLRTAGLWHLVAVSGQNVALVAIAVVGLLGAIGVRRQVVLGTAVAAVVAYCLACEGGASVARAGVMGVVGLVALLSGSEKNAWHALAVGLAALLAWSPPAIGDPGLQLSFAAVVGLLTIAPGATRVLRGWLPGPLAVLAGQSLAASLATAPVLVWQFGTVSLVGLILNIVAVPLAGPTVVLSVAGIALAPVGFGVASAVNWFAGGGANLLLVLASAGGAIPGATVPVSRAATLPLLILAAAIPAWIWWLDRVPPKQRSPLGLRRWRPVATLSASVLALVLLVPQSPRPWPARPTLTVLDVGQGDAILLQSPDGRAALVDTGPAGRPAAVAAALERHGVRRLDVLFLTHAQADHMGAAVQLMDRIDVGRVATPPPPDRTAIMEATLAQAARQGIPTSTLMAGDVVDLGAWVLSVRWPRTPPAPGTDPNDGALVMVAVAPGLRALLTSDAEGDVLLPAGVGPTDVLKVSHHGSADPELGLLLPRIRPRVALISVGRTNRFGHPRSETLSALAAAGVASWRTDEQGDISVSPGADGPEVLTSRAR